MSGWDDTGRDEAVGGPAGESILVGDRRMRVRRRLARRRLIPRGTNLWAVLGVLVLLAGIAVGVNLYLNRPQGLDAIEGPAVVAAGAFQAKIGPNNTITVALEVRNVTDAPVTIVSARLVPPAGLTRLAVAVLPPDPRNQNLDLDAELPPLAPVTLGTNGVDRNGIIAARFQVDCAALPPTAGATGEQIFATVRLGDDEREEELIPPVLGGTPWLTATARDACRRLGTTGTVEPPLPTL